MKQLREKGLTIDDVARALGISKTTVSRALSGKGRVSEETTIRVRNFVNQGGNIASSERQLTYTLSLVIPPRFIEMDLPFMHLCLLGIGYAAKQRDYDLMLCSADENDLVALDHQLERRKSDGVILARTLNAADPCLKLIRQYGLPCVVLGHSDEEGILQADSDHFGAAREMTRLLLQMGMRRIAYLYDHTNTTVNTDRLQGFMQALKDVGIPIDKGLIYSGLITEAQRIDALESALAQKADCLLCCDDRLTLYISTLMQQRGISWPNQIRLASLYDSDFLQHASITAVQFDTVALGGTACRMLVDAISGKEVISRQVQQFQIILRESTK